MRSARLLSLALAGATGLVLVAPAAAIAAPNSHSTGHGPAVTHAGKPAHLGKPADDQPDSTDPRDKPDGDKPAADESARPDAGTDKAGDGKAGDDKAGDDKAGGHEPVGHGAVNHTAGSKGASHALAAATASVTRVAAHEQVSMVLGPPDRAAVAAFNARALSALSTDLTAAGSASSPHDVAGLLHTGKRTAHAVKLVENVVTGSARDAAVVSQLSSAAAALRTQEAGLPAGTDTSSVDSPLAHLATQLEAARTALSTATAAALAIPVSPTATDLQAAHRLIAPARGADDARVSTAAADLTAAQAALTALTMPVGG